VVCFPSTLACVVLFKHVSPIPLVVNKTWLVAELLFASVFPSLGFSCRRRVAERSSQRFKGVQRVDVRI
jgi:hypothetical protein